MRQIIFITLALLAHKGFSQFQKENCICFNNSTKNLKVQTNIDTTRTTFTITTKGFETKMKREKAIIEYNRSNPNSIGRPTFWVNYYSSKKYKLYDEERINKICSILSLEEFRLNGKYASSVSFIYKNNGNYKLWHTKLLASE